MISEPIVIQIIITIGAVLVSVVSLIATLVNRQDNKDTRQDVKDVKEQVKNTHDTNLRQDLDKVKEETALTSASVHRTERYVEDLDTTIRSLEHSLERHTGLWAKAMAEVRSDVRTFRERMDKHVEEEVPTTVRRSLGKAKEETHAAIDEHERKYHNTKEREDDR